MAFWANFHRLAALLTSSTIPLLLSDAARAASFTYQASSSVPCAVNCTGNIAITGTITVDQLGSLTESNITDWNLTMVNGNFSPATIKSDLGGSTVGVFSGTSVTATAQTLIFGLASSNQGFSFDSGGSLPNEAKWQFGGGANAMFFPTGGQFAEGNSELTFPTTFTATQLGGPAVPEPGTVLGTVATVGLLVATRYYRKSGKTIKDRF